MDTTETVETERETVSPEFDFTAQRGAVRFMQNVATFEMGRNQGYRECVVDLLPMIVAVAVGIVGVVIYSRHNGV